MRAKKSLGQNFLMHQQTADRIVSVAPVTPGDTVLEVGPGTGMLTRSLLNSGARVTAVETDGELFEHLQDVFREELRAGHLTLVLGDIRTFDVTRLPRPYHVVANIPYYITGELFRFFLSSSAQPASLTLLVQKEVAERVARSKKESILSLSVKAYGEPRYAFTVSKGSFVPKPKVDSAVLSIQHISREAFASYKEEEVFFSLLHAGFAHKRKLLLKNLALSFGLLRVKSAFVATSLPENTRAEDVPLQTWLKLAKNLAV